MSAAEITSPFSPEIEIYIHSVPLPYQPHITILNVCIIMWLDRVKKYPFDMYFIYTCNGTVLVILI